DPANFGKREVKRTVFERPIRLQDLRDGTLPGAGTASTWVEDKAADGGPGEIGMRHLHATQQIGRLVAARADEHAAALLPEEMRKDPAQYSKDRSARVDEARKAHGDARNDLRQYISDAFTRAGVPGNISGLMDLERRISSENRRIEFFQANLDAPGGEHNQYVQTQMQEAKARLTELRGYQDAVEKALDSKRETELRIRVEEAQGEYATVQQQAQDAHNALATARAKAHLTAIQEVRAVGPADGAQLKLATRTARGKDSGTAGVLWAEKHYPTAWLRHAAGKANPVTVTTQGRGKYDGSRIVVDKRKSPIDGVPITGETAIHEVGHLMEERVPGLVAAQAAFHFKRTTSGEVGSRRHELPVRLKDLFPGHGYRSTETTYRDEFVEPYTGKTYGGRNYEIFTTGVESLFAGSKYLNGDEDFRQFMLGVLSTLGREEG
ncbi:MAG: hypothetical protein ACTHKG_02195, partial [Nocardioides sp.]